MKFLPMFLILASPLTAAEIYKCEVNGKLTFSQRPCEVDAEVVEVDPVVVDTVVPSSQDYDRIVSGNKSRENARARAAIREQIGRLERERDQKLKSIDNRAVFANNNLAGATYRQSLATERQSIVDDYNARIQSKRDQLNK